MYLEKVVSDRFNLILVYSSDFLNILKVLKNYDVLFLGITCTTNISYRHAFLTPLEILTF